MSKLRHANPFLIFGIACHIAKIFYEGAPDVKTVYLIYRNSQLLGGEFVSVLNLSYSESAAILMRASVGTC
jgi:hypothetical protein